MRAEQVQKMEEEEKKHTQRCDRRHICGRGEQQEKNGKTLPKESREKRNYKGVWEDIWGSAEYENKP